MSFIPRDLTSPAELHSTPEPTAQASERDNTLTPANAFDCEDGFEDMPYLLIAEINPNEDVLLLQYAAPQGAPEPEVELRPRGPGAALELLINGQPRALIERPNGLRAEHVMLMDVSALER